jgi:hypothetical protein
MEFSDSCTFDDGIEFYSVMFMCWELFVVGFSSLNFMFLVYGLSSSFLFYADFSSNGAFFEVGDFIIGFI